MNYPHWQLAIPGGMLIALVAVLHVFISHFAVGGGFFLVVTESLARRQNDAALLKYCRRHSSVFCAAYAGLRRDQRRGYLVHDWSGQPGGDFDAHPYISCGRGRLSGSSFLWR